MGALPPKPLYGEHYHRLSTLLQPPVEGGTTSVSVLGRWILKLRKKLLVQTSLSKCQNQDLYLGRAVCCLDLCPQSHSLLLGDAS